MIDAAARKRLAALMTPETIAKEHVGLLADMTTEADVDEKSRLGHKARIDRDKHEIMRSIAFSLESIAGSLDAIAREMEPEGTYEEGAGS